MGLEHVEN